MLKLGHLPFHGLKKKIEDVWIKGFFGIDYKKEMLIVMIIM